MEFLGQRDKEMGRRKVKRKIKTNCGKEREMKTGKKRKCKKGKEKEK